MKTAPFSRRGGFTLLEIMIVVSLVAILSWLAMVTISRIKDRAVRTLIANNLRQLYQAKEYYYSETGSTQIASLVTLADKGYISTSLKDQLQSLSSFEGSMGWHYYQVLLPNESVYAYQGTKPANQDPTGEVIYFPGITGSTGKTSANEVTPPAVNTAPTTPSSGRGNSDFGHSHKP